MRNIVILTLAVVMLAAVHAWSQQSAPLIGPEGRSGQDLSAYKGGSSCLCLPDQETREACEADEELAAVEQPQASVGARPAPGPHPPVVNAPPPQMPGAPAYPGMPPTMPGQTYPGMSPQGYPAIPPCMLMPYGGQPWQQWPPMMPPWAYGWPAMPNPPQALNRPMQRPSMPRGQMPMARYRAQQPLPQAPPPEQGQDEGGLMDPQERQEWERLCNRLPGHPGCPLPAGPQTQAQPGQPAPHEQAPELKPEDRWRRMREGPDMQLRQELRETPRGPRREMREQVRRDQQRVQEQRPQMREEPRREPPPRQARPEPPRLSAMVIQELDRIGRELDDRGARLAARARELDRRAAELNERSAMLERRGQQFEATIRQMEERMRQLERREEEMRRPMPRPEEAPRREGEMGRPGPGGAERRPEPPAARPLAPRGEGEGRGQADRPAVGPRREMPEGSRGEFRPEPRREREEDTPAKTSEDDRRREAPKTQKEPVADQKKQPEQPGGPMFWGDPGW